MPQRNVILETIQDAPAGPVVEQQCLLLLTDAGQGMDGVDALLEADLRAAAAVEVARFDAPCRERLPVPPASLLGDHFRADAADAG
jgi:hypothetical protein